jgi:hypothetical protein
MIALLERIKRLRPRGRQLPGSNSGSSTGPLSKPVLSLSKGSGGVSGRSPLGMDQRGATLVTYVLVLPLLILLIFGSFAVWRIMVIRQTLFLGTYKAARELSYQGRNLPLDETVWREVADSVIRAEVEGNHLIESGYALNVAVTLPDTNSCGRSLPVGNSLFTVKATLILPTPIRVPYLDPIINPTLTEQRTSFVECPRGWEGTPPPEEHIY